MNKLWLVPLLLGAQSVLALAQGPAFVPQLSGGGGVSLPQAGSASGAFVQQLPPGARPRPPRAAAPAPAVALQARNFIAQEVRSSDDATLVVDEDEGLIPYAQGERPSLPVTTQGITVSLTASPETLPTVGAGAVVL